jgi:hypothetical protein
MVFSVLSVYTGPAGASTTDTILNRKVPSFRVQDSTVLDAVLSLGEQENLPLGIEYVGPELFGKVKSRDFKNRTVGEILRGLLPRSKGFVVSSDRGVILLTNRATADLRGNLFDRRLSDVRIPRTDIYQASNLLHMSLIQQVSSPGATGIVGDFPTAKTERGIGPYLLRGMTVRAALDQLVRGHGAAAWIAQVPPRELNTLPSYGLWRIVEYGKAQMPYSRVLQQIISQNQ